MTGKKLIGVAAAMLLVLVSIIFLNADIRMKLVIGLTVFMAICLSVTPAIFLPIRTKERASADR